VKTIRERQKDAGAWTDKQRAAVLSEADRFHNRNLRSREPDWFTRYLYNPMRTKPSAVPDAVGQLRLFAGEGNGGEA